mmetsp:Transcript_147946/g.475008  ORF Transcript_147946/g.475008 Transcript_147946/m.475008 type:complete len:368 (+) Transcript_147946:68-1171(+)
MMVEVAMEGIGLEACTAPDAEAAGAAAEPPIRIHSTPPQAPATAVPPEPAAVDAPGAAMSPLVVRVRFALSGALLLEASLRPEQCVRDLEDLVAERAGFVRRPQLIFEDRLLAGPLPLAKALRRQADPAAALPPPPAESAAGGADIAEVFAVVRPQLVVVTGSADRTARVWDAEKGHCQHELLGHGGRLSSVSVSPDRAQVLTTSLDRTERAWSMSTGECESTTSVQTGFVSAASFSPDRALAVTGSADFAAKVWDRKTGQCVSRPAWLWGHSRMVNAAAFSPDGLYIATASSDMTARVWDPATGRCLHVLRGHNSEVLSLAFSPDASLLATGASDGAAKVWGVSDGAPRASLDGHTGAIMSVCFAP